MITIEPTLTASAFCLLGARVIDPAQSLDRITDVVVRDGRIAAIGEAALTPDLQLIDVSGLIVTPGLIDIHVHTYGDLGFAYPDCIGIAHGVTSYVDAGGPGLDTFDEFEAMMRGRTIADLYCGVYIRPIGIVSTVYIEGDTRSLMAIDIRGWLDVVSAHRDVIKYLKLGAFGGYGAGPLKLGKGLGEILGLPTYTHIGDFQVQPDRHMTATAFDLAERGDMITHIYHRNPGTILDDDGKVMPQVRAAEQRGVLFDIGFGAYNFAFDVAERAYAQGIVPHLISSDLQQYNVLSPAISLTNAMTCLMAIGMDLPSVIERTTAAPARALSITDCAGSLAPGMPADITVLRLESGDFELTDCMRATRKVNQRLMPVMAFKRGVRYDSDLALGQNERNWLPQLIEEGLPAAADHLNLAQRDFLVQFTAMIETQQWDASVVDMPQATRLQRAFHQVRARCGLPLAAALHAAYACYLDEPFTQQIGLYLTRFERGALLQRLRAVTAQRAAA
jgi:dihydroorotase